MKPVICLAPPYGFPLGEAATGIRRSAAHAARRVAVPSVLMLLPIPVLAQTEVWLPTAQVVDVSAYGAIGNGTQVLELNVYNQAANPSSLSQSVADHDVDSVSVQYSAVTTPEPSITMSSTQAAGPLSSSFSTISAGASLEYTFEVLGPEGFVPIDVSAALSASAPGAGTYIFNAAASAELNITGPNSPINETYPNGASTTVGIQNGTYTAPDGSTAPGDSATFGLAGTYTVEANEVYTVTLSDFMEGTVFGGGGYGNTATEMATVDPTIDIAEGADNPFSEYSIVFSGGLASDVPDRGVTLAVLAGTLAGLTVLRRRFAK